jgi:hypothetical protein
MQIEIALDTYDDIFSDFDIRPYRERHFSKDFLEELKLRTVKLDTRSKLAILLLVPRKERARKDEKLIVRRLTHFSGERYLAYRKKNITIALEALVLGIVGLGFLFLGNALNRFASGMFRDFLLIPSWYFIWSALERFLGTQRELQKKLNYYKKLSGASVFFSDR